MNGRFDLQVRETSGLHYKIIFIHVLIKIYAVLGEMYAEVEENLRKILMLENLAPTRVCK